MVAAKLDTWMPLYIGDYLADTMHLSTRQHGAYLLLIFALWRTADALADDDKQLAAIAKEAPREWKEDRNVLEPFFIVEDGTWRHKRVDQEMERTGRFRKKQSANGRLGGRPRKNPKGNPPESQNETQNKPTAKPNDNPNESTHNQSQSHSKKERNNNNRGAEIEQVFEAYQTAARPSGLVVAKSLTPERRKIISARLKEHGIEACLTVISKAAATEHFTGKSPPSNGYIESFRADFNWIFTKARFLKVLERNAPDPKRRESKADFNL